MLFESSFKNNFLSIMVISFLSFSTIYPQSSWTVDGDWVLKDGNKFFAIGLWAVPGFERNPTGDPHTSEEITLFQETQKIFNIIYLPNDYHHDWMRTHPDSEISPSYFSGWTKFFWRFKDQGLTSLAPDSFQAMQNNDILEYEEMNYIRNNLSDFETYIQSISDEIASDYYNFTSDNYDIIWYIAGEPNTGGEGWHWHPSIIQEFNSSTKVSSYPNNVLSYIDLFGNIWGDRYHYERNYPSPMPEHLPTIISDPTNPMSGDLSQMSTYNYAYDGTSCYDYNGKSWIAKDRSIFRSKFYDNVRVTSEAYDSSADILGVNCYYDFFLYPEMAGITVDAIKTGCSGIHKPVWNYYDAYGESDSNRYYGVSENEYLKNIRCQIYTSIIHGATGVLFFDYSSGSKNPIDTYWQKIKNLARELKKNSYIFKGDRSNHTVTDEIHYTTFQVSGKNYVIVANTSKIDSKIISVSGISPLSIEPLGVRIINIPNDFIVINNSVSAKVYLGTTNEGIFNSKSEFDIWSDNPVQELDVGDFNGDSYDDILCRYNNWLKIRYGSSDGTFNNPSGFTVTWGGGDVKEVHVGDFNGDSYSDFIILDNTTKVKLYTGKSDNSFDMSFSEFDFWAGNPVQELDVGDFNGDSYDDILCRYNNWLKIRYGSSDGTFNNPSGFTVSWPGETIYELNVSDFNGDEITDLILRNNTLGILTLYGNNSNSFSYDPNDSFDINISGYFCNHFAIGNFNGLGNNSLYKSPSIEEKGPDKENISFRLSQNFPNPFNPKTKISFSIPSETIVSLVIYNISGEIIKTLINEKKVTGSYEIEFDGNEFASGVYIYSIRAGNFLVNKKMLLIK